jgi:hypothetical protein
VVVVVGESNACALFFQGYDDLDIVTLRTEMNKNGSNSRSPVCADDLTVKLVLARISYCGRDWYGTRKNLKRGSVH